MHELTVFFAVLISFCKLCNNTSSQPDVNKKYVNTRHAGTKHTLSLNE